MSTEVERFISGPLPGEDDYVPDTVTETDEIYALSTEEFTALTAKRQNTALFLLVREMAGTIRALEYRLDEYEAKARELATPEGLQAITEKFLGGMGMGGLGGMFR